MYDKAELCNKIAVKSHRIGDEYYGADYLWCRR
jgi:hypothetical protein